VVARLYNAKVKVKSLCEAFGVDRKTMKAWGDALKSGDPDKLVRVFQGRNRKLTTEIEAYVRMRFPSVYAQTRYEYSKRIRKEVRDVFGQGLSAETLRPLFKELKQQAEKGCESGVSDAEVTKGENPDDCVGASEEPCSTESLESPPIPQARADAATPDNRKDSPVSTQQSIETVTLRHHLGALIFSAVLLRVERWVKEGGRLLKQWLATILLGAVNIEQTKLLNFSDLAVGQDTGFASSSTTSVDGAGFDGNPGLSATQPKGWTPNSVSDAFRNRNYLQP